MGMIYKITCVISGKSYIGMTQHNAIQGRIVYHLRGYGSQIIKRAVAKHGKDAFVYEILRDGIIPELLGTFEQDAIKQHKTLYPNGYNLTHGGDGGKLSEDAQQRSADTQRGRKHSEEHKKKISDSMKAYFANRPHHNIGHTPWNKGKSWSEEVRSKLSDSHKGQTPWNRGTPMSEESRLKLSKSKKGQPSPMKGLPSPLKGIPRSEETKRKISESHRKRLKKQ